MNSEPLSPPLWRERRALELHLDDLIQQFDALPLTSPRRNALAAQIRIAQDILDATAEA